MADIELAKLTRHQSTIKLILACSAAHPSGVIAADALSLAISWDRALAGAALAMVIAWFGARRQMFSASGAWAAWLTGTLTTTAGWSWCVVLLAFFCSSAALSRWRRESKQRRTASLLDKPGARDATQVFANGGVFTAALGAHLFFPSPGWHVIALGAMAAATADTWSTEIGTAIGGTPRSVRSWQPVPAGTSGAVTLLGTAGLCAGGVALGLLAATQGVPRVVVLSVIAGGIVGALVDTLLGATIQERRWCPQCAQPTEQVVHTCMTPTELRNGWRGMTNDMVNVLCTVSGGAVALLFWRAAA